MSKKIILLVGRDHWQKDDALNHTLLKHLRKFDHKIIWEDPAGNLLYYFRRSENKLQWLPNNIRRFDLRFIQLLYGLMHWDYFSYLSGRKNGSIELRCLKLVKRLQELGTQHEIIILSRSAGGRIASVIADDLNIKHIICLSYPFKHPESNDEPERYLHLRNLRTPMLIIQGTNDEYGGSEVEEKYTLSPKVELFFVDANHDFNVSSEDWERVLRKIDEVVH